MTIQFNLEYHTRWGQSVWISGSLPELGLFDPDKAIPMTYSNNGLWQAEIFSNNKNNITYRYFIREQGKNDLVEKGQLHDLDANTDTTAIAIYDQWQNIPEEQPFFSSAFTNCIFHSYKQEERKPLAADSIYIRCFAPSLLPGQNLKLCGDCAATGNWNPEKALAMIHIGTGEWCISLNRDQITTPFNFKFIVSDENNTLISWECGPNHTILLSENNASFSTLLYRGFHLKDTRKAWRGAGVAIPVFSLRSREGYGIGEFGDLILLIDWASRTGQKIIQILPVNDTTMHHTWHDSYPYNANSIFALHPAYIRLEEAGILSAPKRMNEFRKKRDALNKLPEIDYEEVTALKWKYMEELYLEKGKETLDSEEYKKFFVTNKEWLVPYAVFSFLRDKNNTPDFHWWADHNIFNKEKTEVLCSPENEYYDAIALNFFIQFHLDKQLRRVSDYARQKGIVLKGDIPIGISRTSADAWVNPELFHMDCQAGAPPDDFSKEGQNWGFPTYDWDIMKNDHFSWWKKRFTKMADYFDAYRIDHILGFFRIWEIPVKSTQGVLGHFNPALPYTAEEIASFGFNFERERMVNPYIREYFLQELFGDMTQEVKNDFLNCEEDGIFTLKNEFDTQLEIINYFDGQTDEKTLQIRNGLLKLAAEVLFIPDLVNHKETGKYHPRIAAQETKSFEALDNHQKQAFNALYNHFFYERHNEFWCREAYTKLPPLLAATDMLACGEDLGMIPAGVEDVMDKLRILSLEIQRMPKKEGALFDDPATYPYLSVCTTSTHDMSTLREWWEEDANRSQLYYNQMLHREGWKPDICTAEICEQIIYQHLSSPAMFTILPWQDWISIDEKIRRPNPREERINIPAISRHYWRYRMHIPLEDLLSTDGLNSKIAELIKNSGRNSG